MRSTAGKMSAWINQPPFTRICAFAVAAALAYAAWSYEMNQNVRRPPVLRVRPPAASTVRGPATRVVWVMIDGLRLDASRRMPTLERLRAEGEDVTARAEFPTFSGPNLVAQGSGIEPAASGVLSNEYPGEVGLDSVFRRAKLAGLATAIVTTDTDPEFGDIYASWIDQAVFDDPDAHVPPVPLVFVHVGFVDQAGHRSGGASPQYRAAVERADQVIARIASTLDPAREALVVTSDHGHIDSGGHGGTERAVVRIPIVVWGAGAVRGHRIGRARDVGPTIASLLGIGPLAHATGRPLVRDDVRTSRQRAIVRAAVAVAGPEADHVPLAIPVAAIALLVLGATWGFEARSLMSAPTYALVFAVLLLATHTLSFSVSNHSTAFGARITGLCALAGLAQLRIGGRASLIPAALVASVATFSTALAAAHDGRAPVDGTLRFLPIPALAGLAFICFLTAVGGRRYILRARALDPAPLEDPPGYATTGMLLDEPRLVVLPGGRPRPTS